MQWLEMQTLIRDLVGDPARQNGDGTRYSKRHLCDAINYAMKIHATKTRCTVTSGTFTVSAGGVVDMSATPYIEVLGVTWDGNPVDKSFETYERQKDPNYRANTSGDRYVRWFLDTGARVQLIPATVLSPATIKMNYLATPTKVTTLTADDADLDDRINENDQEHLRFLAGSYLKKLLADPRDSQIADGWVAQYLAMADGTMIPAMRMPKDRPVREGDA